MKVLVIGGGGREHALLWKLAQSPRVSELLAVPGNAGMADLARCVELSLEPQTLLNLAQDENVDLTLVGPEVPLVAGIVDLFEAHGLRIFGPSWAAAQLEGSKCFAKAFMARHGIPTANHQAFTDVLGALELLEQTSLPIVVKDSNLAAGKGVTIAQTEAEARRAVQNILGAAEGGELVIEDFLEGQEVSLMLFTDGLSVKSLPLAQDYKQALDGDIGPMTGGMGTIAPVPLLTEAQLAEVMQTIVAPTLRGLQEENLPYKGVIFLGLMVTEAGVKVLEYNVRFGDPETQVVLPLLKTDLVDIIEAVLDGTLADIQLEWSSDYAACVVLAAPGYPAGYPKGLPLSIPTTLPDNITVFHAGTELADDKLVSSGGRVLGVTAVADELEQAVAAAYDAISAIDFPQAHYRRDIGKRVMTNHEQRG